MPEARVVPLEARVVPLAVAVVAVVAAVVAVVAVVVAFGNSVTSTLLQSVTTTSTYS